MEIQPSHSGSETPDRLSRELEDRGVEDSGILSFQEANVGDFRRADDIDAWELSLDDPPHVFFLLEVLVDGGEDA